MILTNNSNPSNEFSLFKTESHDKLTAISCMFVQILNERDEKKEVK